MTRTFRLALPPSDTGTTRRRRPDRPRLAAAGCRWDSCRVSCWVSCCFSVLCRVCALGARFGKKLFCCFCGRFCRFLCFRLFVLVFFVFLFAFVFVLWHSSPIDATTTSAIGVVMNVEHVGSVAVVVAAGRNVGDTPMPEDSWRAFIDGITSAIVAHGGDVAASVVGVSDGGAWNPEGAAWIAGTVKDVGGLRAALAVLAGVYGQDAIALTTGAVTLVTA